MAGDHEWASVIFPDSEVHCVRFGGGGCAPLSAGILRGEQMLPGGAGSEENEGKCLAADRMLIRQEKRMLRTTTKTASTLLPKL